MNEMDEKELHALNGGYIWVLTAVAGAVIGNVVSGWPDFKAGFSEAFWHQQKLAEQ